MEIRYKLIKLDPILGAGLGITAWVALDMSRILAPFSPRRRRKPGRHAAPDLDDFRESDTRTTAPDERIERLGGARAWLHWWMKCPRPPLQSVDWAPGRGFMFIPSFVGFALVAGGFSVLAGPGETFRLGGLLAMLVGIPILTFVGLYILRPVQRRRK
jgi:hypothetical protein